MYKGIIVHYRVAVSRGWEHHLPPPDLREGLPLLSTTNNKLRIRRLGIAKEKKEMTIDQWQSSSPCSGTYLTVCLVVSIWVVMAPTSDCQNALPSQHGLMYENNSGEASATMMTFFDQPVAKPEVAPILEAPNVTDPIRKPAVDPAVENTNASHRRKTSGFVIAASTVAAGLVVLGAVAAAYAVRARLTNRLRAAGSSHSLEEVRLGFAL